MITLYAHQTWNVRTADASKLPKKTSLVMKQPAPYANPEKYASKASAPRLATAALRAPIVKKKTLFAASQTIAV